MRIIQISSRFPYPPDDGGRISVWHITYQLRELGHDVWLVTFAEKQTTPEHIQFLRQTVTRLTVLPPQRYSLLQYLISAVHPVPIHVRKRSTPEILQVARKIGQQAAEWDCIHVDRSGMISMGLEVSGISKKPIAVRMHNVEWVIWQRFAQQFPFWHPARWYLQRQARLLRKWEKHLLSQVDLIIPITEPDGRRIAEEFGIEKPIVVIPAGVDPEYWKPVDGEQKRTDVVLVANFEWKPNIEGVEWFVQKVLPLLPSTITFHIAGKESDRALRHLRGIPNVRIYGYLEDARQFYGRALFTFVPLLSGGGIRIKILEAMAMELPVVTTTVGAEGIEAGEQQGVFRCDDPYRFAQAIQDLLSNPEWVKKLGKAARQRILEKYTWRTLVQQMADAYQRYLKHTSTAGAPQVHWTES